MVHQSRPSCPHTHTNMQPAASACRSAQSTVINLISIAATAVPLCSTMPVTPCPRWLLAWPRPGSGTNPAPRRPHLTKQTHHTTTDQHQAAIKRSRKEV